MDNVDQIKIKIVGESSGATRSIKSQISNLEKLQKQIDALNESFKGKSFEGIQKFESVMDKLSKAASISLPADLVTNVKKLAEGMEKLSLVDHAKLEQAGQSLSSTLKAINETPFANIPKIVSGIGGLVRNVEKSDPEKYADVAKGILTIANSLSVLDRYDTKKLTAMAEIARAARVTRINQQNQSKPSSKSPKDGVRVAGGDTTQLAHEADAAASRWANLVARIKAATSSSLESLKSFAHHFGTVAKAVGGATKRVMKYVAENNALVKGARSVIGALGSIRERFSKLASDIGRIIKYRAIRAAIKAIMSGLNEGIKNAYQYSVLTGNQFAASMNTISTAALYAKNSLGALAMPIVNLVAPAIDYVTDKFVSLINYINHTIASLTGASTWTKAIKYPKAWGEAAEDGASKAKKAADKYKNTILGIDEINPLNGVDDNNPTGGGGGGGTSDDYSSMFETQETEATKLSQTLKDLFTPLKNSWDEYGADVIESAKTAFSSIKDLLKEIGSSMKTVWTNGTGETIVGNILQSFTNINTTIGNIATNLKNAWTKENLGTSIIQDIGDAWASISEHVKGITDGLKNWSSNIDFSALLTSVKSLSGAFKNFTEVKWSILEDAFNDILLPLATWTIQEAVPTVLEGFATVVNDMAEIFDSAWPTLKPAIEGLVSSLEKAAGIVWDTLEDAWDTVLKPLADHIVTTTLPALIDALSSAIDVAGDILEVSWPIVKPVLTFFLNLAETAFDTAVTAIGNLMGAFHDLANGDYDAAAEKAKSVWDSLKPFIESIPGIGNALSFGVDVAFAASGNEDFFNWLANNAGDSPLVRKVSATVKFANEASTAVVDWINSTHDVSVNIFGNPDRDLNSTIENLATATGTGYNIYVYLKKNWKTVYDWVNKASGGNVGKYVELWRKNFTTVWEWIKKYIGTPFKPLVELGKKGWTTLWSWITGKDNDGGKVEKEVGLKKGWGEGSVLGWIKRDSKRWGGNPEKEVGLKKGWGTGSVLGWLKGDSKRWGGDPEKKVGLKKGWGSGSVLGWLKGDTKRWGGDPTKSVGLAKGWIGSVYSWITDDKDRWGDPLYKSINLYRSNSWKNKTVEEWIEENFVGGGVRIPVDLIYGTDNPNITARAMGGTVASGQLFMARENGMSEYVGSFGSQAAVANNDQIVAGITAGVAAAQHEQNRLLREQNELLRGIYAKDSGGFNTSDVMRALSATNSRAGHPVVAIG